MPARADDNDTSPWTFLTSHAVVLLALDDDPTLRIRDIADRAGLTERAVQGIIKDLDDAGYISRRRKGRRNFYTLDPDRPLRQQTHRDFAVGELLRVLGR